MVNSPLSMSPENSFFITCSMLRFDSFWYSANTSRSCSKLCDARIALNCDSSVPHRFSPAWYNDWKQCRTSFLGFHFRNPGCLAWNLDCPKASQKAASKTENTPRTLPVHPSVLSQHLSPSAPVCCPGTKKKTTCNETLSCSKTKSNNMSELDSNIRQFTFVALFDGVKKTNTGHRSLERHLEKLEPMEGEGWQCHEECSQKQGNKFPSVPRGRLIKVGCFENRRWAKQVSAMKQLQKACF